LNSFELDLGKSKGKTTNRTVPMGTASRAQPIWVGHLGWWPICQRGTGEATGGDKANVVADALSRRSHLNMLATRELLPEFCTEFEKLNLG
jgi:hypothetical protein